jgi:putative toxin-antitoxin system antitoxin component (TIGR02293 family)
LLLTSIVVIFVTNGTTMKYKYIKEILGGDELVKEPLRNQYDIINLTRKGLNKKQLLFLAHKLSLSLIEMSRILPVSVRTLQRYTRNQVFNSDVSDQILIIADLYSKGIGVFDSIDKFNAWIRLPNTALSNHKPIELLDTTFGVELVKDLLGRIEHGIIS